MRLLVVMRLLYNFTIMHLIIVPMVSVLFLPSQVIADGIPLVNTLRTYNTADPNVFYATYYAVWFQTEWDGVSTYLDQTVFNRSFNEDTGQWEEAPSKSRKYCGEWGCYYLQMTPQLATIGTDFNVYPGSPAVAFMDKTNPYSPLSQCRTFGLYPSDTIIPIGSCYSSGRTYNSPNLTLFGTLLYAEYEIRNFCSLTISSLTGASKIINSSTGGNLAINGSISDSSGQPVTWILTMPDGKTRAGAGTSVNEIWDCKDGSGKIVQPGSYSATLTAQTADGQCTDTKTLNISPSPKTRITAVSTSSSAPPLIWQAAISPTPKTCFLPRKLPSHPA